MYLLSARQTLKVKRETSIGPISSGLEIFEKRLQTFLSEEKRQVLAHSVALDALQIARTLKFAASIGMRAGTMNAEELQYKRLALDRLLDRTETEMYELQVLLRQCSADLGRVERDLTAQVETSVHEVQQHLKRFQSQHSKESGRAFGALLEDFLMKEVERVFRKWRTRRMRRFRRSSMRFPLASSCRPTEF